MLSQFELLLIDFIAYVVAGFAGPLRLMLRGYLQEKTLRGDKLPRLRRGRFVCDPPAYAFHVLRTLGEPFSSDTTIPLPGRIGSISSAALTIWLSI